MKSNKILQTLKLCWNGSNFIYIWDCVCVYFSVAHHTSSENYFASKWQQYKIFWIVVRRRISVIDKKYTIFWRVIKA